MQPCHPTLIHVSEDSGLLSPIGFPLPVTARRDSCTGSSSAVEKESSSALFALNLHGKDIWGLMITLPDGADVTGGNGFNRVLWRVSLTFIRVNLKLCDSQPSRAPAGLLRFHISQIHLIRSFLTLRLAWIPANGNKIFPGG